MKMGLLLGVLVLTGLVFFTAIQTLPGAQASTPDAVNENTALLATVSRLEEEKLSLSTRLDAVQSKASTLESDLAALKAEEAEQTDLDASASELQQSFEAVQRELSASQQASLKIKEAAEEKAAEFALAQNQVKMLEENIAKLESSAEATKARIAELEASATAGSTFAEERDAALAELASLETKGTAQSKAIAELASLVASVKTRAADLEAEVAARKNTIADLEKAVQLASISPVAACQKRTDALTSEIGFGAGSTTVSAESQSLLDDLAVIVAECIQEDFQLEIEGHTDNVGRDSDNLVLSYWRANAVQDFLTENGIPAESMRAIGFGASDPIADNETADGRQKNRRIVFDWEQK